MALEPRLTSRCLFDHGHAPQLAYRGGNPNGRVGRTSRKRLFSAAAAAVPSSRTPGGFQQHERIILRFWESKVRGLFFRAH